MDKNNFTDFGDSEKDKNFADSVIASERSDKGLPQTSEPFDDEFQSTGKKPKKKWSGKKKAIVFGILGVVVIVICCFAAHALNILNNPLSFFSSAKDQTTPAPNQQVANSLLVPTATPEPSGIELLQGQADLSMLSDDIVNILIAGVDYAPERDTWSGKHEYHSDVMIVLAINTKENTVDMISMPRDTYANIPGVKGIYKLNASINCGGNWPNGLTKTAEAVEWMLGGIPVDYYYGVTMPAVKELVNAVGGVDYNVDIDFTMAGRSYTKGMQHLDGQGVLDYLRVRKNVVNSGDLNRINRQKNMLVAIFRKLQANNLIAQIPNILSAMSDGYTTNTSLSQTAALAVFAYTLNPDNINMHSMDGSMRSVFGWSFCLTDQKKRVSIIKEVYGVDADEYTEYSPNYVSSKWAGMIKSKYVSNAEKVISYAQSVLSKYPSASPSPSPSPSPTATLKPTKTPAPSATAKPSKTPKPTSTATAKPTEAPTPKPTEKPTAEPTKEPVKTDSPTKEPDPVKTEATENSKLSVVGKMVTVMSGRKNAALATREEIEAAISAAKSVLSAVRSGGGSGTSMLASLTLLKNRCDTLGSLVGYGGMNWNVDATAKNEIKVDFR